MSDVFGFHCFSSRLAKKLEHSWKALVHDGVRRSVLSIVFECDISIRHLSLSPSCPSFQDSVSVHRPGFYAERFEKFMCNDVFRKALCECAGRNIRYNHYSGTGFTKQKNSHEFVFLIVPLSSLVKNSPSKKRRAVAHGPQKKAGASGPLLSTQTSSNSQNHLLQHQISSETKEEVEGDSGKSWGLGLGGEGRVQGSRRRDVDCRSLACASMFKGSSFTTRLLPASLSLLSPLQPSSQIALISSPRPLRPATLFAQHPKSPLPLLRENLDPLPRVSLHLTLRMTSG